MGGQTQFTCVDGPKFDGHLLDFDLLMDRLTTYRDFEQRAVAACQECACKIDLK
jgi:ferredoxin/flavodoxin---NADP+ reductase